MGFRRKLSSSHSRGKITPNEAERLSTSVANLDLDSEDEDGEDEDGEDEDGEDEDDEDE
jgi:hypothetical protein